MALGTEFRLQSHLFSVYWRVYALSSAPYSRRSRLCSCGLRNAAPELEWFRRQSGRAAGAAGLQQSGSAIQPAAGSSPAGLQQSSAAVQQPAGSSPTGPAGLQQSGSTVQQPIRQLTRMRDFLGVAGSALPVSGRPPLPDVFRWQTGVRIASGFRIIISLPA